MLMETKWKSEKSRTNWKKYKNLKILFFFENKSENRKFNFFSSIDKNIFGQDFDDFFLPLLNFQYALLWFPPTSTPPHPNQIISPNMCTPLSLPIIIQNFDFRILRFLIFMFLDFEIFTFSTFIFSDLGFAFKFSDFLHILRFWNIEWRYIREF